MLGRKSEAAKLRGRIALPDLPETDGRIGYYLYQALESQLGSPSRPEWELRISVRKREGHHAIQRNNRITRISLRLTAKWAIHRKGRREPVLESRAVSESDYDSTDSLYASLVARDDIERRLARDLGERVALAVLAQADAILDSL